MVCEHLRQIEEELVAAGMQETYRGQAWSENCREFVYFDCVLDLQSIRKRIELAECVIDEEYLGTHMGSESGFYCKQCKDGVMGHHPRGGGSHKVFG